jgi:hypothetical protein
VGCFVIGHLEGEKLGENILERAGFDNVFLRKNRGIFQAKYGIIKRWMANNRKARKRSSFVAGLAERAGRRFRSVFQAKFARKRPRRMVSFDRVGARRTVTPTW